MLQNILNSLNNLRNISLEESLKKLTNRLIEFGFKSMEVEFASRIFFGWMSAYINGAVCPSCFVYLGEAKRVPDVTFCTTCNQKISPIKITPLRVYLAIANKADIFATVPDSIKLQPLSWIDRELSDVIVAAYDSITADMVVEPLIAWLRHERPDILYTILLYPRVPRYIYVLYDLLMDRMSTEEMERVAEEIGLDGSSRLRERLIETIKMGFESYIQETVDRISRVVMDEMSQEELENLARELGVEPEKLPFSL